MDRLSLHPRFADSRLVEALADTPVVLIHGPRQCGKTTLARIVGDPQGYANFFFDDPVALEAAQSDPVGFVADLPELSILDEVQRVPMLFSVLKTAVERNRVPGRFLLTGSANVLLVPHLSESLAGRMEILRLHSLTQAQGRSGQPFRLRSGALRWRIWRKLRRRAVRSPDPLSLGGAMNTRITANTDAPATEASLTAGC